MSISVAMRSPFPASAEDVAAARRLRGSSSSRASRRSTTARRGCSHRSRCKNLWGRGNARRTSDLLRCGWSHPATPESRVCAMWGQPGNSLEWRLGLDTSTASAVPFSMPRSGEKSTGLAQPSVRRESQTGNGAAPYLDSHGCNLLSRVGERCSARRQDSPSNVTRSAITAGAARDVSSIISACHSRHETL